MIGIKHDSIHRNKEIKKEQKIEENPLQLGLQQCPRSTVHDAMKGDVITQCSSAYWKKRNPEQILMISYILAGISDWVSEVYRLDQILQTKQSKGENHEQNDF